MNNYSLKPVSSVTIQVKSKNIHYLIKRIRINEKINIHLGDIIINIIGKNLKNFPEFNSNFNKKLKIYSEINIGSLINLGRGTKIIVIKDADKKLIKEISIEFKDKIGELPQAYVDPDSMRAVLQNLLENAIKYTINGGKLIIGITNTGSELLIEVSDSGIGIPVAEQQNIFNRFFRATNALKAETDGSGLGLYIAKAIVEKHNGRIWFESKEEGGTKFFFTIPIKSNLNKNG